MIHSTVLNPPAEIRHGYDLTLQRLGVPLLDAYDANTFLKRLRGLHAHPPLEAAQALLIRPCSSIQTFGMKELIDVAFLDEHGTVLKIATVAPNRIMACRGARLVVEMAAGTAERIDLSVGQRLQPSTGSWT